MSLSPGIRLGVYEVSGLIGAGGMGEVYRARDTKLRRDVALKILPKEFTEDSDRVARFQREAQILASLNHPNIAAIYGLEESGGISALVLELVEGPTLADRIAQGPIPVDDALPIAKEIAEALEAAHERGIIHRDLKPTNIKLRPDGIVKVLDFGLAKALEHSAGGSSVALANSPTITSPGTMTGIGVILGTAAYMSPEQARGKTIDKRTDIWAFGCVLYEMLTGCLAFEGGTVSETIANILHREPDWSRVQSIATDALRLLKTCLQKDVRRRLRDIADAQVFLESAAQPLGGKDISGPGFVLSIVAEDPLQLPHRGGQIAAPLISPDGTVVVCGFHARKLASIEFEPVREIMGGAPFWSADSTWLACPCPTGLRRVRPFGGESEVIAPLNLPTRGGSWSTSNIILLSAGELQWVSGSGGRLESLDMPQPGMHPEFIRGSDDFLFWMPDPNGGKGQILMATFRNGRGVDCSSLMDSETAARYTSAGGGGLLFVENDKLYWRRFDVKARKLHGEPQWIQSGVASAPHLGLGLFSVASNGWIAWRPGTRVVSQVTTFDRDGNVIGTSGPKRSVAMIRLAPDGLRLLTDGEPRGTTHLLQMHRSGGLPLADAQWSLWTPDGTHLIGLSWQNGRIVRRPAGGVGTLEQIENDDTPADWRVLLDIAKDGRTLLISNATTNVVTAVELEPGRRVTGRPETAPGALGARFSPDGRWIVYAEADRNQGIYVQPFPGGPGVREQIADAGIYPVWRADGQEILYYDGEYICGIAVSSRDHSVEFNIPKRLFRVGFAPGTVTRYTPLAVTADGSRIVFPFVRDSSGANVIHIATPVQLKR